jgi:glycoside/pentoside/hexuronide:cation symporter, GPH family
MDAAVSARDRVVKSFWTRLSYAVGGIPYGVKGNGFSYFLLLFYSQAIGMDPASVGLAIFITFVCDALSDPIVGYISDNTRSRWGRRHPFMYAAALPVAAAYWFLWNPPDLSNEAMFWYLLVIAISVRSLITVYEVPSSALVAELTTDYDERTRFLSMRNMFVWLGGVAMAVITLSFLLDDDGAGSGFTDVDGFRAYGLMASSVLLIAILVTALGTHRTIPYLHKSSTVPEKFSIVRLVREVFETLSNRSFAALFLATLFANTASGVSGALTFYIYGYFWGFSADQTSLIVASVAVSSVGAFIVAPRVSKRLDKRKAALGLGFLAFTIAPLPVTLRLFGLMPENGDPILFPLILGVVIIDLALIISVQILMQSMIADLVEDAQLKTKRRNEGVFFAAISFTRKAVEGFGILLASAILALIAFPVGVAPSAVPDEALFRLGLFYAPTLFILWMIMLGLLSLYKISRETHNANVEAISRMEVPEFPEQAGPATR